MREAVPTPTTYSANAHRIYCVTFFNTHPIQYFGPPNAYAIRNCGLDTAGLCLSEISRNGGANPVFDTKATWNTDSDTPLLSSSLEPGGFVVNEAISAGLRTVASSEIECASDLTADGVDGTTFTASAMDGLAATLRPILTDKNLRTVQGQVSLESIKCWGYADCGAAIRVAITASRGRCGQRQY